MTFGLGEWGNNMVASKNPIDGLWGFCLPQKLTYSRRHHAGQQDQLELNRLHKLTEVT